MEYLMSACTNVIDKTHYEYKIMMLDKLNNFSNFIEFTGFTSYKFDGIHIIYDDPLNETPRILDKCVLNKLKKKERESLNPRTRKNSRWC